MAAMEGTGAGPAWPEPAMQVNDRDWAKFVIHLLSAVTGVDAQAIAGPARSGAPACRARQIAMYLTHTGLGWTLERTGFAFGRNRSTVTYAVNRIEELRDAEVFDRRLAGLERTLRTLSTERLAL